MEATKTKIYTQNQPKDGHEATAEGNNQQKVRRPRRIPPEMVPVVRQLLHEGNGYRRVARILKEEYGIRVSYCTVRNVAKGWSCYGSGTS